MRLYLVQHGQSKSEQEDPRRPLNDEGRRDVGRSAGLAAAIKSAPAEILHSGKARAQETAEILAARFAGSVRQAEGLAPNDPVEPWASRLATEELDLMLVGHLPFMERLASILIAGSAEAGIVKFRMGGVVCLEREAGKWRLLWALWPEMA